MYFHQFPHFRIFHLPQSDVSVWKMKLHKEITDELTKVVLAGYSQKLQQERAVLLPHAVSVFLDNYSHAKEYKELYLELGDGAVKFSARCMVNEPTNCHT